MTTAGGVQCWGNNEHGQLGDGTTTQRLTPVDVRGLMSGVSAIAAGAEHTCALTTTGGVKCWGTNEAGQLGNGAGGQGNDRSVPVDVLGLTSGVSAIAAGGLHTCALIQGAGGIKCWGYNGLGQLGDGTRANRSTPVDASGLGGGIDAVSAGWGHTCAPTAEGGVKCWGDNFYGQLGDGLDGNRPTPVDVVWLHTYADPTAEAGVCGGAGPCYATLAQALPATAASGAIDVRGAFGESLILDQNKTVRLLDDISLAGDLTQLQGVIDLSGHTLALSGNFSRAGGAFAATRGAVAFTGSGVQTLAVFVPTTFQHLTVGNGVTLVESIPADNVAVTGRLSNHGVIRKSQALWPSTPPPPSASPARPCAPRPSAR